tara:strand:+ start:2021 stop:3307 length:1287 start_codon:yes stop_codon:yes gene_type:complete
MGYVGIVTAACLTKLGHTVVGIEPNLEKVAMLNSGKTPIQEPLLEEIIKQGVKNARFKVVQNIQDLENHYDVSFVCVGTPVNNSGAMSLEQIIKVTSSIGNYIHQNPNYHLVAIRSTVTPGTCRNVINPILQKLVGEKTGKKFGLASNPEFLRETTAVSDFLNPEYTIIGGIDNKSSKILSDIYSGLKGQQYILTPEESEMLKISSNAFHALKVGFANEIGRYSAKLNIDSQRVMSIFSEDKKLNISKSYLKPGFAFGGSCLPKDLKSLTYQSNQLGINLPILEGTLASNESHINYATEEILSHQAKSIGVLGLGFKPKSDDVRESPSVRLIQKLKPYCHNISVFDPDIQIKNMLGSNLEYLSHQIPNISNMICHSINDLTEKSSLIVITQERHEFSNLEKQLLNPEILEDKIIINLVKTSPNYKKAN